MSTNSQAEKFLGEYFGYDDVAANYFITHDHNRIRLVAIEYIDNKPHSVVIEREWNNSKETWFDPKIHTALVSAFLEYDFNFSKTYDTIYWHNSGSSSKEFELNGRYCYVLGKMADKNKAKLWVAPDVFLCKYIHRIDNSRWDKAEISPEEIESYGYIILKEPIEFVLGDEKTTFNPFEISEGDTECVYCPTCEDHLPVNLTGSLCKHLEWCADCGAWVFDNKRTWYTIDGDVECKHERQEDDE